MTTLLDPPENHAEPLPLLTVAVRTLCEFTGKQGDLDLRFTPSPSGAEGMDGHRLVVARRGAGYRSEIPLSGQHGALRVRGRADGYDPDKGLLEEIKTHRGAAKRDAAQHRDAGGLPVAFERFEAPATHQVFAASRRNGRHPRH